MQKIERRIFSLKLLLLFHVKQNRKMFHVKHFGLLFYGCKRNISIVRHEPQYSVVRMLCG